jgi:hypothetical protein
MGLNPKLSITVIPQHTYNKIIMALKYFFSVDLSAKALESSLNKTMDIYSTAIYKLEDSEFISRLM